MLSAQYGSVFTQSHYGEIQKVYSIWICSHPPKERENTITSYTLQERHLVGHVKEPVKNYDLMNVTMICLGKPEGENYGGLLRMLEVLFGGRCTPRQVIQILEDEYEFSDIHSMERTVSEMCNLSQGFIEEGRKQGLAQGIEQGIERGIEEGTDRERLQNIRSMMRKLKVTASEAMDIIEIPAEEQPKYLKLLSLPQ